MSREIKHRYTGEILATVAGKTLREADLSRADLHRADLSDADLSEAGLRVADLSEADLIGADLSRADLRGADLSRADLQWADLREADLHRTDLRGADLSRADLRGVDLSMADLHRADLQWARVAGAKWPAPTDVLLARWGNVSNDLTRDLMVFDAWCHPDPTAFDRWAAGGACPYDGVDIQRVANFQERKDLWPIGEKIPQSPLALMRRLLAECCVTEELSGE